jgi:hypothetical protein
MVGCSVLVWVVIANSGELVDSPIGGFEGKTTTMISRKIAAIIRERIKMRLLEPIQFSFQAA